VHLYDLTLLVVMGSVNTRALFTLNCGQPDSHVKGSFWFSFGGKYLLRKTLPPGFAQSLKSGKFHRSRSLVGN
jgi:hypothetical protein